MRLELYQTSKIKGFLRKQFKGKSGLSIFSKRTPLLMLFMVPNTPLILLKLQKQVQLCLLYLILYFYLNKCEQTAKKLQICSHLLNKYLTKSVIFCVVNIRLPDTTWTAKASWILSSLYFLHVGWIRVLPLYKKWIQ